MCPRNDAAKTLRHFRAVAGVRVFPRHLTTANEPLVPAVANQQNVGRVRIMAADWRSDIVDRVRALIVEAEPDAIEEAKWRKASNPDGVPTFSCSGLICTVETYKDKVKITFAKGASLADPDALFKASLDAGTRRAIDIFGGDELDEVAIVELVRKAVALNQA
jgi:hypothetical protein